MKESRAVLFVDQRDPAAGQAGKAQDVAAQGRELAVEVEIGVEFVEDQGELFGALGALAFQVVSRGEVVAFLRQAAILGAEQRQVGIDSRARPRILQLCCGTTALYANPCSTRATVRSATTRHNLAGSTAYRKGSPSG
jgi:hypothetical protein